ncbi:MAG: protein translocase subunit SecD [Myxococcota bacterium]
MNWLRLGAIAALVLGSIYVLLPAALVDDTDARVESFQNEVGQPESTKRLPLTVTAGDAAEVIAAIQTRLGVASVDVASIEADGDEGLVIDLGDASFDTVSGLLGKPGAAVVVALDDLSVDEQDDDSVSDAVKEAVEAAGLPVDATSKKLGAVVRAVALDDLALAELQSRAVMGLQQAEAEDGKPASLVAVLAPSDDEATAKARVLLINGKPAGLVLEEDAVVPLTDAVRPDLAKLVSLAGTVSPKRSKTVKTEAVEDDSLENVPPWLAAILPDTQVNLGLDLQGGIDLTLQVELDAAVLNQAKRDTQGLVEKAKEDDLILDSVTRMFGEPTLEVVSDAELGKITTFMRNQLGAQNYQYVESDGTTHRYEMTDERRAEVEEQSMNQVLETLRKRIDATGVKEPAIVRKGSGRINVQLPGLEDPKVALDVIGQAAVLEFHMVDMEFDDALLEEVLDSAQDQLPQSEFFDDELLNKWLHDTGRLDRDRIVLWSEPGNEEQWAGAVDIWPRELNNDGVLEAAPMVLFDKIELTGNDINDAGVGFDQNNQAGVSIDFKPRGGQVFCDLTKDAVGQRFAIVLDRIIMSAPSIRERICGGSARIDMNASVDPLSESKALALVLRTGALDAPVVVASVSQVGASLGADAIRAGATGAVVGVLIVLLFMALWYRTAGLIADFAIVVNILLVLAALASFGATLTLPGIAGIALTVGMAVDANIIIYERVREELRLGVQPRKAVDVGFEKAVVAVLDANITTAIAGIVLYSYGTGPIKGFAVTLLIGIGTTLVTALFVTRTIMELVTRSSTARLRI